MIPGAGKQVEDFSRENHTITIRYALHYLPRKGLVLAEPKTETSKWTIKLPDFVYRALCDHPVQENQKFLFVTLVGTP